MLPKETPLSVPTDADKRTEADFVTALEAADIANLHRFANWLAALGSIVNGTVTGRDEVTPDDERAGCALTQ